MNSHLSSDELIDAVEGALASARRAHADACAACGAEIAALEATLRDAGTANGVPEPSPLFWDVLTNRVRTATAAEPLPSAGWRWKPVLATVAIAATILLAVVLRTPAPAPIAAEPPAMAAATAVEATPVEDDYAWDLVVTMAANLPHDAVHEVAPGGPAAGVTIGDLTPRERDAFVKLIQREMGGLE